MKRLLLILFIVSVNLDAISQGIYGFDGGIGSVSDYNGKYLPTCSANYLKMVIPHVYLGCTIDCRFFSFNYSDLSQQYADPNYGNIVNIDHKSSYIFFSPLIDVSIGEKQIIHLNCNVGPGFYLYGSETTKYLTNSLPGTNVYNYINTSNHNSNVIYQYSFGISESIPTKGYWSIKFSQQYCILGMDLNSGYSTGPALRSDYYSFTVGISHYYGKVYYY